MDDLASKISVYLNDGGRLWTYRRPEKALHGGDLRVCNDEVSAGAVTVMVRPNGMVYLAPGSCFNEWGSMLTFRNDGSGVVTIRYRSIAKNNGRCPGQHGFH